MEVWGEIHGSLIIRSRPLDVPVIAHAFQFQKSETIGRMEFFRDASASDLIVGIRYLNRILDSCKAAGADDFCASAALICTGYGGSPIELYAPRDHIYKSQMHHGFIFEHVRLDLIHNELQDAIAQQAEKDGRLFYFQKNFQQRLNSAARCEQMSDAIFVASQSLGLRFKEMVSNSTISRYIIITNEIGESCTIRISDHGTRDKADNEFNFLPFHDLIPIFERMNALAFSAGCTKEKTA